jgi:hypothetical protein
MKTNEQMENERNELIELTQPLIEWINKNWHPHVKLIIDCNGFELLEGQIAFMPVFEEFENISNV